MLISGNYSPSQANRLLLLLRCTWSLRVMSGTTQVRGNASRKQRTPRDANSLRELTLTREVQQCKHDGVSERAQPRSKYVLEQELRRSHELWGIVAIERHPNRAPLHQLLHILAASHQL